MCWSKWCFYRISLTTVSAPPMVLSLSLGWTQKTRFCWVLLMVLPITRFSFWQNHIRVMTLHEPVANIRYKLVCTHSEDSNESAHAHVLIIVWRNARALATHRAHIEDSDQTARMRRLIWFSMGAHVNMYLLLATSSFELQHVSSSPVKRFQYSIRKLVCAIYAKGFHAVWSEPLVFVVWNAMKRQLVCF